MSLCEDDIRSLHLKGFEIDRQGNRSGIQNVKLYPGLSPSSEDSIHFSDLCLSRWIGL